MKRDMALVHKILKYVQLSDKYRIVLSKVELSDIPGYTSDQLLHHFQICEDAEYLESDLHGYRLTWEGHCQVEDDD